MNAVLIISAIVGFNIAAPLTPLGALAFLGAANSIGSKIAEAQQPLDNPYIREWARRNGDCAIRLRPGASEER